MNKTSGFFFEPKAEFSDHFTEMTEISSSGFNLLLRAKRNGQWWVLKTQKPDVRTNPLYASLLRKEFDILSRLHHPGVVKADSLEPVEGYGECLVMEWVDGMTLDEWLADRHSFGERRRVVEQLFAAMEYVHSQQVVHRDLKPSNIMITRNGGMVKVIDFGLSDADSYAIFKQPAGTEGYVSSEQRTSEIPDVRNDIYSLGIISRQMHLGLSWWLATRHCLCPLEKRWPNIHALREQVKTLHRRLVAIVVLVSLALCYVLGVAIYKEVNAPVTSYDVVEKFQIGNLAYTSWGGSLASVRAANEKDSAVVIPTTVTYRGIDYLVDEIGDSAFAGQPTLKRVMFPDNAKLHVMKHIFAGSPLVEVLGFRSKVPPMLGNDLWPVKMEDVFQPGDFARIKLIVPKGSLATYRQSPWGRFLRIEEYD